MRTDTRVISNLYRLASSQNTPIEDIMEWIEAHREKYSLTQIARTLKSASIAAVFVAGSVDGLSILHLYVIRAGFFSDISL